MSEACQIEIRRLKVKTYIGVPEDERTGAQELLVTVKITPRVGFSETGDEIEQTVDYAALAEGLKVLALAKPRKLIETLASDIADLVLSHPLVAAVEVMVEKFILPDTECVAVHLKRSL
ncbi:dihydroneopterin aldolase [Luteolibacter luteus]|uniref:dihydroneopterin aldolase n=1 Tax=Luteolibacter luteus TaxID=2728835 RepID=A0A858RPF8_9BACT|nr:dihydroneopterin aldolase [Luteolibacter luteus]QJE98268.1 dihydroneopterin aldolase [Luteolibacter luteus]